MTSLPSAIRSELESYPLQAGPLTTSVKDLSLSVGWCDLRVVPLPSKILGEEWVVLIGHKRPEDPLRAVVPLPIHTTSLRPSSLRSIFASLDALDIQTLPEPLPPFAPSLNQLREKLGQEPTPVAPSVPKDAAEENGEKQKDLDRETIYMAMVTGDSTVVYYKLSKGIKKPADIPDE